jgi:mannose-6-phosphate isomerase-like protein (cupin superfamily)
MEIINWRKALAAAEFDAGAGIAHAPLVGTPEYRWHITRLAPGKRVKAHMHFVHEEHYQIVEGRGMFYVGHVDNASNEVVWDEGTVVVAGDVFTVQAGQVHQLANTKANGHPTEEDLILIFGCHDSHLSERNRMEVEDYPV